MKRRRYAAVGIGIFGVIALGVVIFTGYYMYRQARLMNDRLISEQIEKLASAIGKIHQDCEIIGFTPDRSPVDFLTVKSFAGAEVGPLTLKRPAKWAGPYAELNFKMQDKLYEIVKISDGYAIVPGDGVRLSTGKVFGKDIRVTATTKLEELIQKHNLIYNGKPLVAKFQISNEKPFMATLEVSPFAEM